jgi:transcription initiation factor TFIIH subunit 4
MGMDSIDVLSFLFLLGSLELGQAYSRKSLSESQSQILSDLAEYGIVYLPSPTSSRFYPTRLATTLTSDASALRESDVTSGSNQSAGFIVIETNYRLYAYTTSPLQTAIIELFTRLETRYTNLVSGKITRNSVRRAIGMGITADQIVAYLSAHAHPQMRAKVGAAGTDASAAGSGALPATVVDQIRLWQLEGERMATTPGFLFRDFANEEEYSSAVTYADEVGVLRWHSERKRMFFATRYEQVAKFLQDRKQRTENGSELAKSRQG